MAKCRFSCDKSVKIIDAIQRHVTLEEQKRTLSNQVQWKKQKKKLSDRFFYTPIVINFDKICACQQKTSSHNNEQSER